MRYEKRLLVIPDIHQDIGFAKSVIETEEGNFDKIIFLGDFFDSHHPKKVSGIKETCSFVNSVREDFDCTIIAGNHDVGYYDTFVWFRNRHAECRDLPFYCSGRTASKAKKVSKYLNEDIIKEAKLVHYENGRLFSHAGVNENLWPIVYGQNSTKIALSSLLENADRVWKNFRSEEHNPFFWVSEARGGKHKFGGVTWQDWDEEFEDSLPFGQVCGHTFGEKPRRKGFSWCIDCGQTYYSIIDRDGKIKHKKIENKNYFLKRHG